MFGTLRFNSDTKAVEHVELERADGFEARGYSRTACNECRIRKVNMACCRLASNANQVDISQLKCSGDENGCQRCRAISTTCVYQSNADKSTCRRRRQSTQSSTRSISLSSPDNGLEVEQTTESNSYHQSGDRTHSTDIPDIDVVGGGPRTQTQTQTPCTPPVSPVDLSWALSPLSEAPDLYWDFSSGDFQPMMDIGQSSSTINNMPRASTFSPGTSLNHKSLPQSPDVDHEVAGISYVLDASQQSDQILHQLDQSLISSSSTVAARMRNSSYSPLSMSRQGKKSFPREVSRTQLHQAVSPRRGSQSRGSVINSASTMDPPAPPGEHSWPTSGPSRMHSSPANAFIVPNVASTSSMSGLSLSPGSTSVQSGEPPGSSDAGSACHCVTTMLKILETMGAQGLGTDAKDTGAGFDVMLSSLTRGMNLTEQVLACDQCNACAENGMLLATITQQLSSTAASVTTHLPSQEHPFESQEGTHRGQDRRFSTQGAQLSNVRSSNDDYTRMTSDLLEGKIFFGRYRVDSPEIRLRLTYYALLLHVDRLQEILVRIKERVGSNRGAWKLVVNTGLEVGKLRDIFRSKISHKQ